MPPRISSPGTDLIRTFIREWRQHRHLSQDKLVARVRERVETFSKSSLSRIEAGKQPYSQPILEAIAWALACEPADLIMRNPLLEDALWSITDHLRKATPDQRRAALRVVDALLKTGT
jgi:transcriptional regulator with XRE-family HTH domain